ncbi:pickpocket protein 19-like [Condylostylus longicornis]|uniref:pickpocket protein 19-like n=1 Tax=Condylostylus longicornis TaxID=2530218 RepID=UPI00244E3C1A|nr:pickpocket protein 19-like [Condylostylus longicornis]
MESKLSIIKSYLKICLGKTDIHGIKYLTNHDEVPFWEKIFWFVVLILTIFTTIFICGILCNIYNGSTTKTVLENSIYPVHQIIFPALTICSKNRLNWKRLDIVKKLNTNIITDNNSNSIKFNYPELDNIDLFEVIRIMSIRCDEMFIKDSCKWINENKNCCDIFGIQKNKFGFCQTFNSVVNEHGMNMALIDSKYPYRLAKGGVLNGLSFKVKINRDFKIPGSKIHDGFIIMLHHCSSFHGRDEFIPIEVDADIKIQPILFQTEMGARKFSPKIRKCFFNGEPGHASSHSQAAATQCAGGTYQSQMGEWNYVQRGKEVVAKARLASHEGSNISPTGGYWRGDKGFNWTLSDWRSYQEDGPPDYLSNTKAIGVDQFFEGEKGIDCICYRNCRAMEYDTVFHHHHYLGTDVTMNRLTLLVDVGGIAGLLLGCSIITFVELIYFTIYGFISIIRGVVKK